MLDWLWTWPPMQTAQGWVEASRGAVDPLWAIVICLAAVLAVMGWLAQPPDAARDRKPMGHHYRGRLTPKTLGRMLRSPRPRRARTRAEMERAVARAARARRRAEGKAPSPDGEEPPESPR